MNLFVKFIDFLKIIKIIVSACLNEWIFYVIFLNFDYGFMFE
jgi:hypothetical protein